MSYKPHYNNGSWLAICDACGRKFPATTLRMRWDNVMTCEGDWEPRHPQDFVRGVADIQAPKWTRPEQTDAFILIPIPSSSSVLNASALNQFGMNT